MLTQMVIYREAFLYFVTLVEWQVHEALIIFNRLNLNPWSEFHVLCLLVLHDGEKFTVVHRYLLTFIAHL